jgi:hypothetical protein
MTYSLRRCQARPEGAFERAAAGPVPILCAHADRALRYRTPDGECTGV